MFVCAAQSHCFNVLALAVGVLEAQLKKEFKYPSPVIHGWVGEGSMLAVRTCIVCTSEFMHNAVSPCVRVQYFQLLL